MMDLARDEWPTMRPTATSATTELGSAGPAIGTTYPSTFPTLPTPDTIAPELFGAAPHTKSTTTAATVAAAAATTAPPAVCCGPKPGLHGLADVDELLSGRDGFELGPMELTDLDELGLQDLGAVGGSQIVPVSGAPAESLEGIVPAFSDLTMLPSPSLFAPTVSEPILRIEPWEKAASVGPVEDFLQQIAAEGAGLADKVPIKMEQLDDSPAAAVSAIVPYDPHAAVAAAAAAGSASASTALVPVSLGHLPAKIEDLSEHQLIHMSKEQFNSYVARSTLPGAEVQVIKKRRRVLKNRLSAKAAVGKKKKQFEGLRVANKALTAAVNQLTAQNEGLETRNAQLEHACARANKAAAQAADQRAAFSAEIERLTALVHAMKAGAAP